MRCLLRKMFASLLAAVLFLHTGGITALAKPDWPSDTGILANGGIVMDLDSGAVLFGQNIHVASPPASITKVLTALVVVENCSLDETVTFSEDAIYNVEAGSGNSLGFETGDTLSVEDALYAMILVSSNPAANALAEHVAGSRDGFADMMNAKLDELGCEESHFANPSGLNDENQYVSPYDMALIARAAFQNETVLNICSTKSHSIPPTINNPEGRSFRMEHRLIITDDPQSEYYLEGATAGKTGYTSLAGNTLVTLACRDGRRILSVILKGTQPQYYMDAKTITEFAFASFQNLPIAENETWLSEQTQLETPAGTFPVSELSLDSAAVITLPNGASFTDAQRTLVTDLSENRPANAAGMLEYTYNDRVIGSSWIYAESLNAASDPSDGDAPAAADPLPEESEPAGDTNDPSESPTDRTGIPVLPLVIAAAVILAAAGGVYVFRLQKRKEQEELARRKARRRQRLLESGVSEEEFAALLRERQSAASRTAPPKRRKH